MRYYMTVGKTAIILVAQLITVVGFFLHPARTCFSSVLQYLFLAFEYRNLLNNANDGNTSKLKKLRCE